MYDHDHIGFRTEYSIMRTPVQSYHLTIQNPRDILTNFETLPMILQNFIVKYHAKCNNCGYCTQRSKGKQKPYTIVAKFKNKSIAFCPINYVYTYCWNSLNDELADELIAYLEYLQKTIKHTTK
ncbi:MAG: hypothetical protein RR640_00800 [Oscillospiraceae bacterium]